MNGRGFGAPPEAQRQDEACRHGMDDRASGGPVTGFGKKDDKA